MDRDRSRRSDTSEPIHGDQEKISQNPRRHPADNTDKKKTQREYTLDEETKIKFTITARRVRIDPEHKRQGYIDRLETLVEQLDNMINNPRSPHKLRLRAMEVLIKTINTCYNIVSDIEVELLENEVKAIKKTDQGTEETLGYTIQEDPTS